MIGIPEAFWFMQLPTWPQRTQIPRRRKPEPVTTDRRRKPEHHEVSARTGDFFHQEVFAASPDNYWEADFWEATYTSGIAVERRREPDTDRILRPRRPERDDLSTRTGDFFQQEFFVLAAQEEHWDADFFAATYSSGIPAHRRRRTEQTETALVDSQYFNQAVFSNSTEEQYWSADFWQSTFPRTMPTERRRTPEPTDVRTV